MYFCYFCFSPRCTDCQLLGRSRFNSHKPLPSQPARDPTPLRTGDQLCSLCVEDGELIPQAILTRITFNAPARFGFLPFSHKRADWLEHLSPLPQLGSSSSPWRAGQKSPKSASLAHSSLNGGDAGAAANFPSAMACCSCFCRLARTCSSLERTSWNMVLTAAVLLTCDARQAGLFGSRALALLEFR